MLAAAHTASSGKVSHTAQWSVHKLAERSRQRSLLLSRSSIMHSYFESRVRALVLLGGCACARRSHCAWWLRRRARALSQRAGGHSRCAPSPARCACCTDVRGDAGRGERASRVIRVFSAARDSAAHTGHPRCTQRCTAVRQHRPELAHAALRSARRAVHGKASSRVAVGLPHSSATVLGCVARPAHSRVRCALNAVF